MIVNNTASLSYMESRTVAFVATVPSIVIIRPDGTIDPAPPAVILSQTPDGLTATLQANYAPTQAGSYLYMWNFADGVGPVQRPLSDFAYWTDVTTLVRQFLQMKVNRLADSVIAREFALNTMQLLARFTDPVKYPCLASYAGLSASDREYFDQAVSALTAMQLYPLKFGSASGVIDQVKVGSMQFNYQASKDDPRDAWAEKAATEIGLLSCVRASRLAAAATWNLNRVTGPGRAGVRRGISDNIVDDVLDVYQDRFSAINMVGNSPGTTVVSGGFGNVR